MIIDCLAKNKFFHLRLSNIMPYMYHRLMVIDVLHYLDIIFSAHGVCCIVIII